MRSHRILVVDDYPSTAQITCTLLQLLGHETRAANSGKQALELALIFEPDIAILDIGLPDLSGYEIARDLRAGSADRPLFLAALTGWGQPEDRERAMEAGFDCHFLKPTDASKLRDILKLADRRISG
jgi:CheY-like chemotaxis protein